MTLMILMCTMLLALIRGGSMPPLNLLHACLDLLGVRGTTRSLFSELPVRRVRLKVAIVKWHCCDLCLSESAVLVERSEP